ncbi:hypothetical protein ABPG74_004936 [Tetrahymena malaccensis]
MAKINLKDKLRLNLFVNQIQFKKVSDLGQNVNQINKQIINRYLSLNLLLQRVSQNCHLGRFVLSSQLITFHLFNKSTLNQKERLIQIFHSQYLFQTNMNVIIRYSEEKLSSSNQLINWQYLKLI